jgi:hypothetical protein
MALAAVQTIVKGGLTPAYATPGASEIILGPGPVFLHVKNTNAAACVFTIVDPYLTPSGSAAQNPTVSVPATTGEKMINIPASFFQAGQVTVQFSITASVLAAVFNSG